MAGGVAERKIGEQKARHAAMADDIHRRADNHRRDSVRFKVTRNQTHGLVADRSYGEKNRPFGTLVAQQGQQRRGVFGFGFAVAVFGGHAVEMAGQARK